MTSTVGACDSIGTHLHSTIKTVVCDDGDTLSLQSISSFVRCLHWWNCVGCNHWYRLPWWCKFFKELPSI